MAKRNIIAEYLGRGMYRKRAYCPKCGKRVTMVQKKCRSCGQELDK